MDQGVKPKLDEVIAALTLAIPNVRINRNRFGWIDVWVPPDDYYPDFGSDVSSVCRAYGLWDITHDVNRVAYTLMRNQFAD